MANVVENLGNLERRITFSLLKEEVQKEVDLRVQKLAKTVRMPGFRPGKVPLKIVAQQHAGQLEAEVLSDKVGKEFFTIAKQENLRIAGQPQFKLNEEADQNLGYTFDATFEIYPEIKIGDLSEVEVVRATTDITDEEVDLTLEVLRKQRVNYIAREADQVAQDTDRVTVDFEGKIDGEVFQGGAANDFAFVLGEGQMLPEFEKAALGLKVGEQREFDLAFPEDYHGKEVAGKTARFKITVKKIEAAQLPDINEDFVKSIGIESGDVTKMREEVKANLEREAQRRIQNLVKKQVTEALLKVSELDVPKALVQQDQHTLAEMAREDMKQRGIPNADKAPIPVEIFAEQANNRVKLGLIFAELVKAHQLEAKPEQIKREIEEFAKSYEDPQEVVRWYFSDKQRLAEMEAYVVESNVVEYVLANAKVVDKAMTFEELAAAPASA